MNTNHELFLRKELFLKEGLKDALKWLLVGAVVGKAAKGKERCPNQDAIGMFTNFVQARALNEFYYKSKDKPKDDARATDFLRFLAAAGHYLVCSLRGKREASQYAYISSCLRS